MLFNSEFDDQVFRLKTKKNCRICWKWQTLCKIVAFFKHLDGIAIKKQNSLASFTVIYFYPCAHFKLTWNFDENMWKNVWLQGHLSIKSIGTVIQELIFCFAASCYYCCNIFTFALSFKCDSVLIAASKTGLFRALNIYLIPKIAEIKLINLCPDQMCNGILKRWIVSTWIGCENVSPEIHLCHFGVHAELKKDS